MGWSIELTADREIVESDVADVLGEIAGHDVSKFPHRQAWGWSSLSIGKTDVWLPSGNVLRVSGAWFSEKYAHERAREIAKLLMTKKRYHLVVGELHG